MRAQLLERTALLRTHPWLLIAMTPGVVIKKDKNDKQKQHIVQPAHDPRCGPVQVTPGHVQGEGQSTPAAGKQTQRILPPDPRFVDAPEEQGTEEEGRRWRVLKRCADGTLRKNVAVDGRMPGDEIVWVDTHQSPWSVIGLWDISSDDEE
jgi:hypothetical protein